jgi:hypothetical protein
LVQFIKKYNTPSIQILKEATCRQTKKLDMLGSINKGVGDVSSKKGWGMIHSGNSNPLRTPAPELKMAAEKGAAVVSIRENEPEVMQGMLRKVNPKGSPLVLRSWNPEVC